MAKKKTGLLAEIASSTGMTNGAIQSVLDAVGEAIADCGFDGVDVPGLGRFHYQPGETYEVVNPGTGESVTSQKPPTLAFSPSLQMGAGMLSEMAKEDSGKTKAARQLPEIRLRLDEDDAKRARIKKSRTKDCKTKLGGTPDWIQSSETIDCCGAEMTFFGQFDSSISDEFNIVDCAIVYVFTCDRCGSTVSMSQFY